MIGEVDGVPEKLEKGADWARFGIAHGAGTPRIRHLEYPIQPGVRVPFVIAA
jgi:hypothetical protein